MLDPRAVDIVNRWRAAMLELTNELDGVPGLPPIVAKSVETLRRSRKLLSEAGAHVELEEFARLADRECGLAMAALALLTGERTNELLAAMAAGIGATPATADDAASVQFPRKGSSDP